MPIPPAMLPHTVTVVEPAVTVDSYGDETYDYGDDATRTDITAWLQQDIRTEQFAEGRDPLDQRWLLVTNHSPISGHAHVEWAAHPGGAVVFHVDGPTEPTYTPAGLHHTEATLRIAAG